MNRENDYSRILVVDDESFICQLLSEILESHGYEVESAGDGIEALEKCGRPIEFDLIISDLNMPEMGGLELIKVLRTFDKDIPIIILTSVEEITVALRVLQSGANDYLIKDAKIQETVLLATEKAFEKKRILEENKRYVDELATANANLTKEVGEREKAEKQLKIYADELNRSNQALKDFASIASHDLQEPLRKIQLFISLLTNSEVERSEKETGYLDRIQNASKRMQAFIRDLLQFSKVSTQVRSLKAVDLNEVIDEVVSDLEIQIKQTGGTFQFGSLPIIKSDPLQMRQLFQNLISNSLKFRRDDVDPIVKITGHYSDDGFFEIVLEDNGTGIEEKDADLVFKPFERLHAKDKYEGTGLGLAICSRIIEEHGGVIQVASSGQGGAKFTIRLPREKVEDFEG